MMAEKRIIESEMEKVRGQEKLPRELFPVHVPRQASFNQSFMTFTSPTSGIDVRKSSVGLFNNTLLGCESSGEVAAEPKISTPRTSYLNRREEDLKQDNGLLAAQNQSANDLLEMKTRAYENYGSSSSERQKLCSVCHLSGHQKNKCKNTACKELSFVGIETNIRNSRPKSKI